MGGNVCQSNGQVSPNFISYEAGSRAVQITRISKYISKEKKQHADKLKEELTQCSASSVSQVVKRADQFLSVLLKSKAVNFLFEFACIREDCRGYYRRVRQTLDYDFEPGKPSILCSAKGRIRLSEGRRAWEELLLSNWKVPALNHHKVLSVAATNILAQILQSGKCQIRQALAALGIKGRVSVHLSSCKTAEEALEEWVVDEGLKDRPNRRRLLAEEAKSVGVAGNAQYFCLLLADES